MTYDTNKKYVELYADLKKELIRIENQMVNVKAISYEPVEGGKGKTINELLDDKDKVKKKMHTIVSKIDALHNSDESLALWYRYIDECKIKEVAKKIRYSIRQTNRIIQRGIKNL